ncbi:nucleotidyl transferase AbiEii/AbiGii toxin family protein [Mesotoga sp. UBA5847]|jgi:predicted nucleotidyltransferase component of viral defense system|uniref:nucleotidyl transferase AbiEii/AbiGii toxin family protein n=1 Tax=Mesotoga sp. UBA5847 TaxID=1946859 RepID=UPI0025EA9809|nr:nucleotidyl transferase AbiEii/AbiGii toxin family protein [Mesotoga sp. UBA5847]
MNKAASVKARLRNLAEKQGRSYQDLLQIYALERAIYRLSLSPHKDKFTLKGGIFLYALFEGRFPRSTTDIDLLGQRISNEKESLEKAFYDIFSINTDDGIRFDLESMNLRTIADAKKYPGTRVSITAYMERTRLSVTVDVGFGDCITPERVQMEFPVLLNDPQPVVFAYSKESVIAEKLEAMASLGFLTSRYKDFYDIFLLSRFFPFTGTTLQAAIRETFRNRGTHIRDIVAFENQFTSDSLHQRRWTAFAKKKNTTFDASLEEVIGQIKNFLVPVLEALQRDEIFASQWEPDDLSWK